MRALDTVDGGRWRGMQIAARKISATAPAPRITLRIMNQLSDGRWLINIAHPTILRGLIPDRIFAVVELSSHASFMKAFVPIANVWVRGEVEETSFRSTYAGSPRLVSDGMSPRSMMNNAGGLSEVTWIDRFVAAASFKPTCKVGIHLLFSFAEYPRYVLRG